MDKAEHAQVNKDMKRWQVRKDKQAPKPKHHLLNVMTQHALQRAGERNVRVKDVLEGRAKVKQILTPDKRYITIIPEKS